MGIINIGEESTAPDAPSTSRYKIYPKTDGLYYKNSLGAEERFGIASDSIYGSELSTGRADYTSTNNNTGFATYLSTPYTITDLTSNSLYELAAHFVWNYNDTGTDFRARLKINDIVKGEEFRLEPKDANADQRFHTSMVDQFTGAELGSLSSSVNFEFAPSINGETARMYRCFVKLVRIA